MAARKLQTEIDRTLKKVAEGVESFEGLYEKLQQSTNQTQKEKLESDLKTQIKKLQRLRDQIKTWLQSNEIKDKKPLLDNRKLIETQMERFKACEKEMKTKAFSKEGLIAAARLDPSEKAKVETIGWLSSMVDELARQVESAEAEIEVMAASGKKKKGTSKDERASSLETQNERRGWHISRLELLMRMLENGHLEADRVTDVKDDISYFVESNFEEDFEEDEGIYDEFNLDDEEEAFGLKDNEDLQSSHDGASVAEDLPPLNIKESPTKPRSDSESNLKREDVVAALSVKKTIKKITVEPTVAKDKAVPTANFAQAKAPSPHPGITSPPKAPSATLLPPIRYAAAAAAAVTLPVSNNAAATTTAPPPPSSSSSITTPTAPPLSLPVTATTTTSNTSQSIPATQSNDSGSAIVAHPSPPPSAVTASTEQGSDVVVPSPTVSTAQSVSGSVSHSHQASQSHPTSVGSTPAVENAKTEDERISSARTASPVPPGLGRADSPSANGLQVADEVSKQVAGSFAMLQPSSGPMASLSVGVAQKPTGTTEARLPSSLTDLVSSFESAKQKSLRRDNNLSSVHKSLESSFMNVPEPMDSDKPKYYVAKNPFPTPAYYPQAPASVFDSAALYSKFDVDTLFYIFYYEQGTYHQYLAAKELKKQSWRFHKQYLTWFQRHSEPQAITDEYEEGVYVYFDWERSWCQRKKSDFRFEYRWLEDN